MVEKPNGVKCVVNDVSDGYLKFGGSDEHVQPIKLPHKNYEIMGIVYEAINSPYAAKMCNRIVDGYGLAVGFRHYKKPTYLEYLTKTPIDSFKSLLESYGVNYKEVGMWEMLIETDAQ